MRLSEHEQRAIAEISQRLSALQQLMRESVIPEVDTAPEDWFRYLAVLKETVGNFHQWLSFVSCVPAKQYLVEHLDMKPFDVGIKPQGAPGLDIDAETRDSARVIAEIKTTVPYLVTRFGSEQRNSILRDIEKLQRAPGVHKYLFVTNSAGGHALKDGFRHGRGLEVLAVDDGRRRP